jgi:hypothetical protein
MLSAVTSDNTLWVREPVFHDIKWHHVGHANKVVGMAPFSPYPHDKKKDCSER